MPIYTCPECQTKLKKKEPLAPGKKLKCSECDAIFAVKGEPAAKPAAPPPPSNRFDDDDGPANYQLIADAEDAASKKARESVFDDPLKERFEKSKRGPALEKVVKPSNVLLLSGVLTCLLALGGAFWSIFPLIFKVTEVNKPKTSLYATPGESKTTYVEVSEDEKVTRLWCLAGFIFFFIWGAGVCAGASKMHEIEMYWLAMLGSVMAIIGPLVPLGIWLFIQGNGETEMDMAFVGPAILCFATGLPVSLWAISTLRSKVVLDGFNEEPME